MQVSALYRLVPGLIALGVVGFAGKAEAALVFEFNEHFDGPTVPDGTPPWARLTITTENVGSVHFFLENLTPPADTNKLKSLWFNVDPIVAMSATHLGGFAFSSFASGNNNQNGAGGTKWDIRFEFSVAGPVAFSGGQSSSFRITGTGLTENSFNAFATQNGQPTDFNAMIHFLSAGPNEESTHVISRTAVPGPAAIVPFAVGMIGLSRRRRRRG